MNKEVRFILDALAFVLDNRERPREPNDLQWEAVYNLSVAHSITNLIAYAVICGKYLVPDKIKAAYLKSIQACAVIDENQKKSAEKIFACFEEKNLDYMPLKGILLKDIYPSSDMRVMGDLDILIKKENLAAYDSVMRELGYTFSHESVTEYVFEKPPFMYVELHKYMINPANKDLYKYYGTGWQLALEDSKCKFKMSIEETYIYTLAHLAKHYRSYGIGIKHFVDIWMLRKKYTDMDMNYIEEHLKKLNLYEFEKNVFKLVKSWFDGDHGDSVTKDMTEFVISSGTFGTAINGLSSKSAGENYNQKGKIFGKIYLYGKLFFEDKDVMKKNYPILVRFPVLLPVFWVYRCISNFSRVKIKIKESRYMFGEHVDAYQNHMQSVGLDIHRGMAIKKRKH